MLHGKFHSFVSYAAIQSQINLCIFPKNINIYSYSITKKNCQHRISHCNAKSVKNIHINSHGSVSYTHNNYNKYIRLPLNHKFSIILKTDTPYLTHKVWDAVDTWSIICLCHWCAVSNAVRYNIINFHNNPHTRHLIACLWVWDVVFCEMKLCLMFLISVAFLLYEILSHYTALQLCLTIYCYAKCIATIQYCMRYKSNTTEHFSSTPSNVATFSITFSHSTR